MKIVTEGAILFWIWCAVMGVVAALLVIILGWWTLVSFVAGMGMVLFATWLVSQHDERNPVADSYDEYTYDD